MHIPSSAVLTDLRYWKSMQNNIIVEGAETGRIFDIAKFSVPLSQWPLCVSSLRSTAYS